MDPVAYIRELHRLTDELLAPLESRHHARLACAIGCASCCVDGLTVFEVEAKLIRRNHRELLESGAPGPAGACAFLDERGACRIYEHRPYVCRTQGLPLRWLEELDGEPVEYRDICPLNAEGEPIETLPADDCWSLGPVEQRLAAAQERFGEPGARTSLRELFGTD